MLHRALWITGLVAAVTMNSSMAAADPVFQSPLDLPAVKSALAMRVPFNGLAKAGKRLVTAGQRGYILYTDDGKQWTQASVPVSSDLTALFFPTSTQGWAVGNEGVILHTSDGGATWEKQLDGKLAAELIFKSYGHPTNATDPAAQQLQKDAEAFVAQGADKPFLDVWFEDDKRGFVVGAFNLIFRTEDGGRSWTPWLDRIENPKALHLYAIRAVGDAVMIAGEQGLLLKLDRTQQRFTPLAQPYSGTLFGVTGTRDMMLIFGLGGNAYRSTDGGANWTQVNTGIKAGLTSGLICADGSVVLASQAGQVLLSKDNGSSFTRIKLTNAAPVFAAVETNDQTLALVGIGGVRFENLK